MGVTVLLWLFGIIYIAACIWMMIIVLLQEGKSGGMGAEGPAAAPAALTESLGVGAAQKHLFAMTSWTAVTFFVIAIVLTILADRRERAGGTLQLNSSKAAATTAPAAPKSDKPADAAGTTAPKSTTPPPKPVEPTPIANAPKN